MQLCMYAGESAFMYVCEIFTHARMPVRDSVFMYVCNQMCKHESACMYTYMYVCMNGFMYV